VRLLFLVFLVFITSCNQKESDKIDEFWSWFKKNESRIYHIDVNDPDDMLNELLSQISKIEPDLSLEIERTNTEGVKNFVVSPEGDIAKFEIVQKIIDKSPELENWNFIAFRQRANENFILTYENIELDVSELFFHPIIENDSLDIIIYGKGFDSKDFNDLTHYGLIMIDNLIGEYDCLKTVRYFDFQDLANENPDELFKLSDLPEYIDEYKKQN
jgi:hypothetical protein